MNVRFRTVSYLSLLGLLGALMGCAPSRVQPTPTVEVVPAPVVAAAATSPAPNVAPSATPDPATLAAPAPPQAPPPATPQAVQLTTGGCCVQPFFSADGNRVLFMDRPTSDAPTGIYGVAIDTPLAPPTLFSEQLGPFSSDLDFAVNLVNGQTIIQSLSDATQRFGINNGGRSLSFSPDDKKIAWTVGQDAGNFDVRRNDIWLANLDGSDAKRVISRYGGGIVAWFSDSRRMLISGKAKREDDASTLVILNLDDGSVQAVFSGERMRGFLMSPDDRHVAFYIAQAQDETLDGLYLLSLDAPDAPPQRLDFFGAYQSRDGNHLLYIPLKLNLPSHELWQLDVTTGQAVLLVPASPDSAFKVTNRDWVVAANGQHIVFVSARDRNLWLLNLPQ